MHAATSAWAPHVFAPLVLVLFILAIVGWGHLAARLAGVRNELSAPPLICLSIAFGLTVLCWILGWLNYFQQFTPSRAVLILCTGAIIGLYRYRTTWLVLIQRNWILVLISGMMLSFWIYFPPTLNGDDDTVGYAAFIVKLRDLGGIGPEPFSGRRLYMMGAQYPLQAISFSLLGIRYLSICEPTLGMALTMIFVAALRASRARFGAMAAILLTGFSGLLGSGILGNLAPAFLMMGPLLLLIYAAVNTQDEYWLHRPAVYGASLGALVSLLTCLRPTAALPAGLMLVLSLLPHAKLRSPGWPLRCLKAGAAAALVGIIFVLPLSLDQYRSSGTYLYPFLGIGFQPGQSHRVLGVRQFASGSVQLITLPATDGLLVAGLLAFGLWLFLTTARWEVKLRTSGVVLTVILTEVLIAYGSPASSVHRYSAPLNLAFLLYLACQSKSPILKPRPLRYRRPLVMAGASVIAASLLACIFFDPARQMVERKINRRMTALYPPASELEAYRKLQTATPVRAVILASLEQNYLLDFRRNQVLINDLPSYVGLPPGWPPGDSAPRLAAYLRHCQIQYVAVMSNEDSHFSQVMKSAVAEVGSDAAPPFTVVYRSERLLLYRVSPG